MPPTLRRLCLTLPVVAVVACSDDRNPSTDLTTSATATTPVTAADDSTTATTAIEPTTSDPGVTGATSEPLTSEPTSEPTTTGGPGGTTGPDPTTGTTGPDTTTGPGSTGPDTTTDPGSTGTDTGMTTGMAGCDPLAPRIVLSTTLGDLVVQLDAVNAPITVANFREYVESGFYDGTIVHRVIPGFVMQGGGYTPDLTLKPTNAPIPDEFSPALKHVVGAISMASAGPDTATSQFFVCDEAQPQLDGNYAAFGVLVEGFAVLDAIMAVPTHSEKGLDDVPVEDVILEMAYCDG